MSDNIPGLPGPVNAILEKFVAIVTTSGPATVGLVLSSCFGYGISFVLLDYRRAAINKAHYLMHVVIGLGYAATIFSVVNFDLLSHNLTVEQITARLPITLTVSFVVAFVVIIVGMLWRERTAPYATDETTEEDD